LVQRVELQIKVLVICRDSGVPDALPHWPIPAFQTQKCPTKECLLDVDKLTAILTAGRHFGQAKPVVFRRRLH
ncbi:hypothetical protein, partial [Xanthomonas euvesicatoria]|uniref:hypothetical protein n=1 Tax=Xanthomonas euvesicatoria TaxID=456327 RepID=UPI001E5F9545